MSTDPNADILAAAEITVRAVKQEFGRTLDYSINSLEDLETLIQHVKSHLLNLKNEGKLTEQTVQRACISIGGYLGEVIRRRYGGTWIATNAVMKTLLIDDQEFSPILYIFRRLIKGADSSLETYLSEIDHKLRPQEKIEDELPVPEIPTMTTGGRTRNRGLITGTITGLVVLAIAGMMSITTHPGIGPISPTITPRPAATEVPATSTASTITEEPMAAQPINFLPNLPDGFEVDQSVEGQDKFLDDGTRLFSIGYINRQAVDPGDLTSVAYFINFYPDDVKAISEYRKYVNDLETKGEGVLDSEMGFVGTDASVMYMSRQNHDRVAGQYTSRVKNVMVTTVGTTVYDPQTITESFLKSFMAELAGFHILGIYKTQ